MLVIKLVCNTKYDTKSHPLTGGTTSDFSPTKSDENGSNPPMLSILSTYRVFASGGKLSAYKDSFDMPGADPEKGGGGGGLLINIHEAGEGVWGGAPAANAFLLYHAHNTT